MSDYATIVIIAACAVGIIALLWSSRRDGRKLRELDELIAQMRDRP